MKIFTSSKNLVTPHDQSADFVELFFDLVFVYAITRITAITAHDLDGLHIVQGLLIFWLIWWGWSLLTTALNAANTKLAEVRMGVLIATAISFLMASSISDAFGDRPFWFAVPYVIIHFMGMGLHTWVTRSNDTKPKATIAFAFISMFGVAAILYGCTTDPGERIWWWLAGLGLNMVGAFVGARFEGWKLYPRHLAERHSLILIIALGESLIVSATAVSGQERNFQLLIVGGLAVLVTCLLWWSYFAWINEHLEAYLEERTNNEQVKLGRDVYILMHFPIVAGIIGMAIGFEKILGHPEELLSLPVALTFAGGFILYIGFTAAAIYRASKVILIPRLIILVITLAGIYFSIGKPPYVIFGIVSLCLAFLVLVEWNKCRRL